MSLLFTQDLAVTQQEIQSVQSIERETWHSQKFFQTWTTLKVDRGDTLGRFENTFTDETDEANRVKFFSTGIDTQFVKKNPTHDIFFHLFSSKGRKYNKTTIY